MLRRVTRQINGYKDEEVEAAWPRNQTTKPLEDHPTRNSTRWGHQWKRWPENVIEWTGESFAQIQAVVEAEVDTLECLIIYIYKTSNL